MKSPSLNSGIAKQLGEPTSALSSRAWFPTVMWGLFLVLSFSTFKYIPGVNILFPIWVGSVFLFLILLWPFSIVYRATPISSLELYCLAVLICIPLIAAYASNNEFGQPWEYGIQTMAQTMLVGDVMIFLYLAQARNFSLDHVERAFVWLAWINLLANLIIPRVLDADSYSDTVGFVGGMEGSRVFTLPSDFICIGFYYYAFASYWEKDIRGALVAALIFMVLLMEGGRAGLISVLCSYLFFVFRWGSAHNFVWVLVRIGLLATAAIFVASIVVPDELVNLTDRFGDAFSVLLKQVEVDDISANARVGESDIAVEYVGKHWLLGNGSLSPSWNEGYKGVFGYFHPSDIGILGVMYMYGLFGTALLAVQYYFAVLYCRALPISDGSHYKLFNALKGYLAFIAVNSFSTGKFAVFVEHSLLLIAILFYAANVNQRGGSGNSLRLQK